MVAMGLPRILCIMGSGETAPTMAQVHIELLSRVGEGPAVFIDTPFGFQENADELSARAQEYFSRKVGRVLDVASFRSAERATELERETCMAAIAGAAYVFAGPGSPTYALDQWRESPLPGLLRDKLRTGGVVTFASAAAVSLGVLSLPVYEIYKVGHAVHWISGLDLISEAGISAVVVPHFNNAEGGTHDTRYCYMGERRLRQLESMMPDGSTIIGVDEHTALILDLDRDVAQVRGRGRVVHRLRDAERIFESGAEFPLDELRGAAGPGGPSGAAPSVITPHAGAPASASPLAEVLEVQRRGFEAGASGGDVDAMVAAILALESAVDEWSADTDGNGLDVEARALLRRCVVRLGEVARQGAGDPRDRVAPFVEAMLRMREEARTQRRFGDADRVRDLLAESGVEVRDGRDGSEWVLLDQAAAASPLRR
jgi:cyanophycinase-like exopeptidase